MSTIFTYPYMFIVTICKIILFENHGIDFVVRIWRIDLLPFLFSLLLTLNVSIIIQTTIPTFQTWKPFGLLMFYTL